MKNENIQIDWHDKIDSIRRELDPKIDKKISDGTFWTVIGFLVVVLLGISAWLMNINQRITCVETKVEMSRGVSSQQIAQPSPQPISLQASSQDTAKK